MKQMPPARDEPFAVIIPDDACLTAPMAAATELSKIAIIAANKVAELEKEIWVEDVIDVDGNIIRTITHYPRDYKWFLDFERKTVVDIAKINSTAESKQVDQKLELLNIFLSTDSIDQEQKQAFAEKMIRNKKKPKKTIDPKNFPVKNKGREY